MRPPKLWFVPLLIVLASLPIIHAQEPVGITHGPLSGEVSAEGVVLWARGSEAGTLTFEVFAADDEAQPIVVAEVPVEAGTDFTGEVQVGGLSAHTPYIYTVRHNAGGDVRSGSFTTAPAPDDESAIRFVFGACLGGQGYCRNPETGWDIFATMAAQSPDFFLITGDGVYVDAACPVEDNRNVAGAETVAKTLPEFYARYRYHLEDEHYASFVAETPVYVTWDDHEIVDNFGAQELLRFNPQLWEDGRKAFFDYWAVGTNPDAPYQLYRQVNYGAHADFFILDTRSYRDPLVNWDPSPVTGEHKTMLGEAQFAWLQQSLAESEATWKFIVTSVPIGYPTGFPQPEVEGRDGWANGGDRSGYENEMMRLLFYIESHDIQNVVFLTGDTHYPFAIEYDPDMDGNANFLELGSSPMSAIVLPPATVDQTFNPNVLYAEGEFNGDLFNFGVVEVADDATLTFRIVDRGGVERFALTRSPQ